MLPRKFIRRLAELYKHKKKVAKFSANLSSYKELKVACIMDEFTYSSFEPEFDCFLLTPGGYISELSDFNPDFIFIESAWKGNSGKWETLISNLGEEIAGVFKWAKLNNVHSIFWNKEDPVHFSTFLPVAKLADYIFTTDPESIFDYQKHVNHHRVFFLPFAVQPLKHNPIEQYSRQSGFCFAGSYYSRYPQRVRDFKRIYEVASANDTVDIYDRHFESNNRLVKFPSEYQKSVKGNLSFKDIDLAYKGYRFGININTVKQSQGMFARRVLELMASNTLVISNYARSLKLLFGDLIFSSDSSSNLELWINELRSESLYRKIRLSALRKVMLEHTYADRRNFIVSKLSGANHLISSETILVVNCHKKSSDMVFFEKNFNRQSYTNLTSYDLCIENFSESQLKYLYTQLENYKFISFFHSDNFYGENYLQDLMLGFKYNKANIIGKGCFFTRDEKLLRLQSDGMQYQKSVELKLYSSVIKTDVINSQSILSELLLERSEILIDHCSLSIDEFNYCENYYLYIGDIDLTPCKDIQDIEQGINLNDFDIYQTGGPIEGVKNIINPDDIKILSAEILFPLIKNQSHNNISITLKNRELVISSNMEDHRNTYCYFGDLTSIDEIEQLSERYFAFDYNACTGDFRVIFEYYDDNREKLSHNFYRNFDGRFVLTIPHGCRYFKYGFRVQGEGKLSLNSLMLGKPKYEPKLIVLEFSTVVLFSKKQALESALLTNSIKTSAIAYIVNDVPEDTFYEYGGIDVIEASEPLLVSTIKKTSNLKIDISYLDECEDKKLLQKVKSLIDPNMNLNSNASLRLN